MSLLEELLNQIFQLQYAHYDSSRMVEFSLKFFETKNVAFLDGKIKFTIKFPWKELTDKLFVPKYIDRGKKSFFWHNLVPKISKSVFAFIFNLIILTTSTMKTPLLEWIFSLCYCWVREILLNKKLLNIFLMLPSQWDGSQVHWSAEIWTSKIQIIPKSKLLHVPFPGLRLHE